MYLSYNQTIDWFQENKQELTTLAQQKSLVFCPSYESLTNLIPLFRGTTLGFGAQNCSAHSHGAYTGQIMARSLQEIGVHYCIIGHSEVRHYFHETNEQLMHKLEQLLTYAITPIFCVGETKALYEQQSTLTAIAQQLQPVVTLLQHQQQPCTIFIAYEPVWAIGTGVVAHNDHIQKVTEFIHQHLEPYSKQHAIYILYGGTVTPETASILKQLNTIQGFLIGKASTNFQELKKIVS